MTVHCLTDAEQDIGSNVIAFEQLEIRFAFEEECLAKGLPIKGKAFFAALKEKLEVPMTPKEFLYQN